MPTVKLTWEQREQWATEVGDSGLSVEVVVTRARGQMAAAWWCDGFDRVRMSSPKPVGGVEMDVRKAKKEGLKAAVVMLEAMRVERSNT